MSTLRRSGIAAALAALAILAAACQDISGSPPSSNLVIGVIDAVGPPENSISGPTGGAVGEPLTFSVTTFGSSCYHAAGAQLVNQGLQMTVIPYDSISAGPCRENLQLLPRDVVVVFDRSGDAVLRLQGRSFTGRSPVVVTRQMQIRP